MKYPLILGELVKLSNLYDNNLYNCKNTHLIVKNGHLKKDRSFEDCSWTDDCHGSLHKLEQAYERDRTQVSGFESG